MTVDNTLTKRSSELFLLILDFNSLITWVSSKLCYRNQYLISSANGKLLTIEGSKNVRRPIWFGYVGDGNWTWIGSGKVWDVDLSQISPQTPTLSSAVLAQKYGLAALPLPQNWQIAVGQEYTDAFLTELKSSQ